LPECNIKIERLSTWDAPASEVILELAREGKLKLLVDNSVVGKTVTLYLANISITEALKFTLMSAGLSAHKLDTGDTVIGTSEAINNYYRPPLPGNQ
jgi:hypothetical protein